MMSTRDAFAAARPRVRKHSYRVPRMSEVRDTCGSNGLTVVSTFSGCGGSCLGFRMAGYRVLWANEFVHEARNTYALNHPDVMLDGRDIREINGADVLTATGLLSGELDVFEGSPPCASFSTVGARERHWGSIKKYSDTKQRTDDLFFEYARLLRELQPRAFVAENVKGLVTGSAWGYFEEILRALRGCGYRVRARVLDAQWLGVPQTRNRVIFVGVREDLGLDPVHPLPIGRRYVLRDALAHLEPVATDNHPRDFSSTCIGAAWRRLLPGEQSKKYFQLVRPNVLRPCPAITASGGSPGIASVTHPYEPRKFTLPELRRICGFPPDFELTGSFEQQWERLGRSVPPVMMFHVARTLRDQVLRPSTGREAAPT